MIQADMHMHTWFSTDSEACPRDMADEAVRKGLKTICFTDHFDKDDLEWGEEGIFDVDAYFCGNAETSGRICRKTEYQDWNRTGT